MSVLHEQATGVQCVNTGGRQILALCASVFSSFSPDDLFYRIIKRRLRTNVLIFFSEMIMNTPITSASPVGKF